MDFGSIRLVSANRTERKLTDDTILLAFTYKKMYGTVANAVQYRESKCYNNSLSSLSRVLGADMGVYENWYGPLIAYLHPFSSFCI